MSATERRMAIHRPLVQRTGPRILVVLAGIALATSVPLARAALPPRHGGTLALPAPEPITRIDPLRARTPFEVTLAEAVFDGLYEARPSGVIEPVLAEGSPIVEERTALVHLRAGVLHHGGRPLTADDVVRSFRRASHVPELAWLFAGFATERGQPSIRALDERTVAFELARPGLELERVLAASPLAIVVGGNLARRPLGTGPFRARLDGRGGVELTRFAHAADAPPWLDTIRFSPPVARDDEVRAFELGRLDGSWWAQSLYGGQPLRPPATARASTSAAILLVPNRTRALRSDALWGSVAAAVDRRRLERIGLEPDASLAPALPAPALPGAGPLRAIRLRMPVRAGQPFESRLAEAIAGMLDEHRIRLAVDRVPAERYEATVARGEWDLRLALVRPPLPGLDALVATALAKSGHPDRARRLAEGDSPGIAGAARNLGAMVLGRERIVLHHRADLRGLSIDERGRISLADVSFARAGERSP